MKNIIQVENLEKHFGKVKAVDGVNFAVPKGEIFGFLGENGAGKTTTIRCMMDFIHADKGRVEILGLDSHKDSVQLKGKIGYLSGNVRLYDKWTGLDHIHFVESIRGKSQIASNLVERLNLNPRVQFHHLSSGNKQKLGLILALMNSPELLIMDEPTVGLDPVLQNEIYEILAEFKKKGTAVFLSSHNLTEVEKICDQVGIIKQGKMIAVETIADLEGKRFHEIEFRSKDKISKTELTVAGVDRVEVIADGCFILTVSGDINKIIRKISQYQLSDLEVRHASLEDIFLKYYRKEK